MINGDCDFPQHERDETTSESIALFQTSRSCGCRSMMEAGQACKMCQGDMTIAGEPAEPACDAPTTDIAFHKATPHP